MLPLAQPPRKTDGRFDDWMYRLWKRISSTAGIAWSLIDKTGSNLTDIQTRNHNDLQTIQGGTASEYYHLTNAQHAMFSTGWTAGTYTSPSITDNLDGTVTLGSGDYCFYSTAAGALPVVKSTIAGALYTFTDNSVNFIVADYNAGTPIMYVTTSEATFNYTTIYPVVTVSRVGTDLDILGHDSDGIALANKLLQRFYQTLRYQIEPNGFALSEAATRYVVIASGYVWNGVNRVTQSSFNSSVNELSFYYHVAGVWTKSTITQYNNSQYDNGTNLVALGGAKYAVNWIFKSAGTAINEAYIVLGSGDYNLVQALASTVPANLPFEISNTGFLVGRIIVASGASTATEIDSAFEQSLNFSPNSTATDLATTGASVNVSAASPPSLGQVLIATSSTTATWQAPVTPNLISSSTTIAADTSYIVASYLTVTSDLTINGNLLITG